MKKKQLYPSVLNQNISTILKECYLMAFLCLFFVNNSGYTQNSIDDILPVRGLCIAGPESDELDRFTKFIEEELSQLKVNLLILRIDYNYQYQSHPELANIGGLSRENVKALVEVCKKQKIRLIPQVNLLGHQSWHGSISNLLKEYPEFDETPWVNLPKGKYQWPNKDGLYCKSYCPLHPEVHNIVFDLIDEIVDVFEADAFHAGMDEVFYIGEDKCPRCNGIDKAKLFADEVTKISNYLSTSDKELWIWGDRLIDGKFTGIGMWEASMNDTHRAIDMIPKSVVINDWHYERPDPTAAIFAAKGFRVATCPWRNIEVAKTQLDQIISFRSTATTIMKDKYLGMIQTIWTSNSNFLDIYYGLKPNKDPKGDQVGCFKQLFKAMAALEER